MESHQVRIHVDQKPYHSAPSTSGIDLYELADVPDGRVLYREVTGDA